MNISSTSEKIILEFQKSFFRRFQKRSVKKLLTIYGRKLETFVDFQVLCNDIRNKLLYELMEHEPFLNLPILAYFTDDKNHYFAYDYLGNTEFEGSDELHSTFRIFGVGEDGFGIKTFIMSENFTQKATEFKTMRDVVSHYFFIGKANG